jgi:hypothetical protein
MRGISIDDEREEWIRQNNLASLWHRPPKFRATRRKTSALSLKEK